MTEKIKKPFYKKWWFWVIVIIIVIAAAAGAGGDKNQANEATKSTSSDSQKAESTKKTESKPRLTLDDGWQIDKSNPYSTQVTGTVSNNSDQDIKGYIQISFSALDASGANVGDCLANANTVDAHGKWKFDAYCTGNDIDTVRFKDLSGF